MNKSRAACLSFPSGCVIVLGIVIALLIFILGVTLEDGSEVDEEEKYLTLKDFTGSVWLISFVYIIPAFFCVSAAFTQNKCFYITSSIFALIGVVVMGFVIVILGYPMVLVVNVFTAIGEDCEDESLTCYCRQSSSHEYIKTPFTECSVMEETVNLFIAIVVLNVVAWIFLFASFIISIVHACLTKHTAFTVNMPVQQPMLTEVCSAV